MPDDDDIAYARERLRYSVWGGFETADDRESLIGDLLDEDEGHNEEALRAYGTDESARKAAAEALWPAVTDCNRLEGVFAALASEGVLGLHNAGYTMGDGHSDAAEALAQEPPGRFFGYCFYHGQDVERAVDGHGLLIAFDHIGSASADRLRVGKIVEAALRRAGFEPAWDGAAGQRIDLPGFDWKRRGP